MAAPPSFSPHRAWQACCPAWPLLRVLGLHMQSAETSCRLWQSGFGVFQEQELCPHHLCASLKKQRLQLSGEINYQRDDRERHLGSSCFNYRNAYKIIVILIIQKPSYNLQPPSMRSVLTTGLSFIIRLERFKNISLILTVDLKLCVMLWLLHIFVCSNATLPHVWTYRGSHLQLMCVRKDLGSGGRSLPFARCYAGWQRQLSCPSAAENKNILSPINLEQSAFIAGTHPVSQVKVKGQQTLRAWEKNHQEGTSQQGSSNGCAQGRAAAAPCCVHPVSGCACIMAVQGRRQVGCSRVAVLPTAHQNKHVQSHASGDVAFM